MTTSYTVKAWTWTGHVWTSLCFGRATAQQKADHWRGLDVVKFVKVTPNRNRER